MENGASAKKAQIFQRKVNYLGYLLKGGQYWLSNAPEETILHIPFPKNPKEAQDPVGSFLAKTNAVV